MRVPAAKPRVELRLDPAGEKSWTVVVADQVVGWHRAHAAALGQANRLGTRRLQLMGTPA